MSSRLVNVRLDEARLRKAQKLRESGITLSDLVREAIDEAFAALREQRTGRDVEVIMRRIFDRYPDPADLPQRPYDIGDRRAVREAIVRRVRRSRQ